MRSAVSALIGCFLVSTSAVAQDQAVTTTRFMGNLTCGGWRAAPSSHLTIEKAALLNWVLGFIAGRAMYREIDLLANVDQASVAAWLDDHCAKNPLDGLERAAILLEAALLRRAAP
jgi:hypothetical protein